MAEAIADTIPCERCNTQINLEDWTEHLRTCSISKSNRRKREKRESADDESDNEQIPCEFCNILISIGDWKSHLKMCADTHRRRIENLRNGIDNEPTDVFIPCEYCDTQVSLHDLEWHTRQCADGHTKKSQIDESTLIPCEYCNVQVNTYEWEEHTKICVQAEKQRIEALAQRIATEPSDVPIPCEYCDKPFSMQKIGVHQKKCRREQTSSAFRPDTPHDQIFKNNVPLPENWDVSSAKNLSRYTVNPGTEEYQFVADNFHKTLPSNQIVQLERIQNRRWYRQYDAHKEDFIERYGSSTEQWLFHGCRKSESAEAIILDCFNRSHAVNCAVGQGIYFATQAAMSHSYTHPDAQRHRHMFMARVLVGRTTAGNSKMRVCPPGFDTTGGENVFVTYHDAQAYAQYLIVYI